MLGMHGKFVYIYIFLSSTMYLPTLYTYTVYLCCIVALRTTLYTDTV